MIASPTRIEDMKARRDMLECMGICLRLGLTKTAKEIGQASSTLKRRIDTHDYRREDAWERRLTNQQTGG